MHIRMLVSFSALGFHFKLSDLGFHFKFPLIKTNPTAESVMLFLNAFCAESVTLFLNAFSEILCAESVMLFLNTFLRFYVLHVIFYPVKLYYSILCYTLTLSSPALVSNSMLQLQTERRP